MPPKRGGARGATAPKAGRGGGRPKAAPKGKKLDEEELSDEDYAPDEKEQAKAGRKKRTPAKKPVSEEEEDEMNEEDLDEDEDLDDEDEEEEEEEDEEDGEEGKANSGKAKTGGGNKQKKTLFIKNLPTETTTEQIKALSCDILEVRMDVSQNKSEKNPKYAIIEFKDAETAEKNLQELKGKKVNGVEAYVDFVGGRSIVTFVKPQLTPSSDPLKLYVTGFGRDIVIDQLKEMFPTSTDITLPLNPKDNNRPVGYAFIHYSEEEIAKQAHDSMQDYVYQGRTLVVMYGKKTTPESEKAAAEEGKRKAAPAKGGPAAKKKKHDDDDEDEEDENEDDEEEEDEEELPGDEEDGEDEDNE